MWNQSQLSAFEKVLDEFQKYDNTAGVFVGNEVLTFGRRTEHQRCAHLYTDLAT